MRFTEHDDVVQALPSDRADESFNISILPGRSGRDRPVPNAHGAQTPHKDCPVRGVPTPEKARRGELIVAAPIRVGSTMSLSATHTRLRDGLLTVTRNSCR